MKRIALMEIGIVTFVLATYFWTLANTPELATNMAFMACMFVSVSIIPYLILSAGLGKYGDATNEIATLLFTGGAVAGFAVAGAIAHSMFVATLSFVVFVSIPAQSMAKELGKTRKQKVLIFVSGFAEALAIFIPIAMNKL